MRIQCLSGYFKFYPESESEIARFQKLFGALAREGEFYTFAALAGAPRYSLFAQPYMLLPAVATFEGDPSEVMDANEFVYNLTLGLVVPKLAILSTVLRLKESNYYYVGDGLIQPGSFDAFARRAMSYECWFDWSSQTFRYTLVNYE